MTKPLHVGAYSHSFFNYTIVAGIVLDPAKDQRLGNPDRGS